MLRKIGNHMKRFNVFIFTLGMSGFALGGEAPPIAVSGFADMSCGAWISSSNDPSGRIQYLAWLRGFISGVNYSDRQKQIKIEKLPSNETLILYVDKYCRDNPLSNFPGAAFKLVEELR